MGVNLNRRNVIDVYDIINQKFCHEIVVNSPYLFDRITGIQVHNLDSIYFCQRSPASIFVENLNIVGETLYSNGTLGVNSYLPLSDGLLIGKQTSIDNEEFLNLNQIIKIDTLTY